MGLSTRSNGIEFFPDTPEEAAPEVAKALMHAFVNRFGGQASQAIAPWNLMTEDKNLAATVGDEFKKLGVGYEALHKAGVSTIVPKRCSVNFLRHCSKRRGGRIILGFHTDAYVFYLTTPASSLRSDQ